MKLFGFSAPRFVLNILHSLLQFVLLEMCLIVGSYKGPWIVWLLPSPVLIIFVVDVIKYRNAFGVYVIDKSGVSNCKKSIDWQSIANVELLSSEMQSRMIRQKKIKQFSICIGEVSYGDLFSQSPKECIILPCSRKSILRLHYFAYGRNPVLDCFLDGFTHMDS